MPAKTPPEFCQYVEDACDKNFSANASDVKAFFAYPNDPQFISAAIEAGIKKLQTLFPDHKVNSWKNLDIAGKIIFCQICQAIRFAEIIVADISTLNFNVMFEIGFAIGLNKPLILVRDFSLTKDEHLIKSLGLFNTMGQVSYQNADELAQKLLPLLREEREGLGTPQVPINTQKPLYFVKDYTEGSNRLISDIQKLGVEARFFDESENYRISINEAQKQIKSSVSIIGHLLSPDRHNSNIHNARIAFFAGLALAYQKSFVLFQEDPTFNSPIDFAELIYFYKDLDSIPKGFERILAHILKHFQTKKKTGTTPKYSTKNILESLDLGDVAAENETNSLNNYFVKTAQFLEAKKGRAQLIIGRKGTGKTAIFYALQDVISKSKENICVDLKPEGFKFSKLRDFISNYSEGIQEHTLTAFWLYSLLCEITSKILEEEKSRSMIDPQIYSSYQRLEKCYEEVEEVQFSGFAERLNHNTEQFMLRYENTADEKTDIQLSQLTNTFFEEKIHKLIPAICGYLKHKEQLWILIDNLDKAWPTKGSTDTDILMLRALLDANRKLKREFTKKDAELCSLVFLRNDIYEHLVTKTPDKGKDSPILLEWDDPEAFKELVRQRLAYFLSKPDDDFSTLWHSIFESHVGVKTSFDYMLDKTLYRPRDLLNFIRKAIETAINHGHSLVSSGDIQVAEIKYSEDMLYSLDYELNDVYPDIYNKIYAFYGYYSKYHLDEMTAIINQSGMHDTEKVTQLIDILLWYGFLGVEDTEGRAPKFSYLTSYNLHKLMLSVTRDNAQFIIHPAYHKALELSAIIPSGSPELV